jgi:hypothetical protein
VPSNPYRRSRVSTGAAQDRHLVGAVRRSNPIHIVIGGASRRLHASGRSVWPARTDPVSAGSLFGQRSSRRGRLRIAWRHASMVDGAVYW